MKKIKKVLIFSVVFLLLFVSGCAKTSNSSNQRNDDFLSSTSETSTCFQSTETNLTVESKATETQSKQTSITVSDNKSSNAFSSYSSSDKSSNIAVNSTGNNITSSYSSVSVSSASSYTSSTQQPVKDTASKPTNSKKNTSMSFRGIWISCFELNFSKLNSKEAQNKLEKIMKNVSSQGYTAVFCHVRPYGDAFYPSNYFPYSKYLTGTEGKAPDYDALKLMISAAKKYNLEFHAWINPYRVSSSSSNSSSLSKNNIAKNWLTDSSGRAVAAAGGIYYNPACPDVQKLILNGIKEILENYQVDGIHFDDYFYPTTDKSFDSKQYNEYLKNTTVPLSLEDWRRANVSSLVSAVYRLCHSYKNVVFGISPAGNISLNKTDKNYLSLYADIPLWMSTEGYIDYIIPQLYFGYEYPQAKYSYQNLLDIWVQLPKHKNLKMYVGLGAYKIGNTSVKDFKEWCDPDGNLLAKQVASAKEKGLTGVCVFSYTASVSSNKLNSLQIDNMFKELNKKTTGE